MNQQSRVFELSLLLQLFDILFVVFHHGIQSFCFLVCDKVVLSRIKTYLILNKFALILIGQPVRGGVFVSDALELSAVRSFLKLNIAGTPTASCCASDEACTFSTALLESCMSSTLSTLFITLATTGDADSKDVGEVRMDIPDCIISSENNKIDW
jgi:hypothetical protein